MNSITIHNVVEAKLSVAKHKNTHGEFYANEIILTDKKGNQVDISFFSDDPIPMQDGGYFDNTK